MSRHCASGRTLGGTPISAACLVLNRKTPRRSRENDFSCLCRGSNVGSRHRHYGRLKSASSVSSSGSCECMRPSVMNSARNGRGRGFHFQRRHLRYFCDAENSAGSPASWYKAWGDPAYLFSPLPSPICVPKRFQHAADRHAAHRFYSGAVIG